MDTSQRLEDQDRERAVRKAVNTAATQAVSSIDGMCVDCDGPIEPARLAVLGATARCASCAHDAERGMRRWS